MEQNNFEYDPLVSEIVKMLKHEHDFEPVFKEFCDFANDYFKKFSKENSIEDKLFLNHFALNKDNQVVITYLIVEESGKLILKDNNQNCSRKIMKFSIPLDLEKGLLPSVDDMKKEFLSKFSVESARILKNLQK